MTEEKIRRYWIGKNPTVRLAVEEYLRNCETSTQIEIAKKHGISDASINKHMKALRLIGLKMPFVNNISCLCCDKPLLGIYPRFVIMYQRSDADRQMTSYFCNECGEKIGVHKYRCKFKRWKRY